MATRSRILVWLGVAVLLVGTVIALRTTEDPTTSTPDGADEPVRPVRVDRFATDVVVVPQPGRRPAPPDRLVVTPDSGTLRLSWADGLPRGVVPAGAAGYDVRWQREGEDERTRLVAAPDTQLDGLADGARYQVSVRTVDAFGQRSEPVTATGVPGRAEMPWRAALTGLYDDFSTPDSVLADTSGSHWHMSGYRGCVDLGPGRTGRQGLPIELGCGADVAVLRARQPLRLTAPEAGGEVGRVAVRTDTAGPGGLLTIDLVAGPADRVGVDRIRTGEGGQRDSSLPGGTIRVSVSDDGVEVSAAPDVAVVSPPALAVLPAPRRGPGVAHLFEVALTTSGVRVYQDGQLVAVSGVVPSWQEASVLLGFRGPEGRRSRVHVSAAGFSGPAAAVPKVVEVPVNPGIQRVLGVDEPAPQLGIARTPLVTATAARMVATVTITDELDPHGVVVQFGDITVPARSATPVPPTSQGAALTVIADVPATLLGNNGPHALTPFVLRARGASLRVALVESYLEITPGPDWQPTTSRREPPRAEPVPDPLPDVEAVLSNAAGEPLTSTVVPRRGQLVLNVTLDASAIQWDTGAIGGVQGFQVWLDGSLIAGVPTRTDGPGLGGRHAMSIALGGLEEGAHVLEVREYTMAGDERPLSMLLNFTVR